MSRVREICQRSPSSSRLSEREFGEGRANHSLCRSDQHLQLAEVLCSSREPSRDGGFSHHHGPGQPERPQLLEDKQPL